MCGMHNELHFQHNFCFVFVFFFWFLHFGWIFFYARHQFRANWFNEIRKITHNRNNPNVCIGWIICLIWLHWAIRRDLLFTWTFYADVFVFFFFWFILDKQWYFLFSFHFILFLLFRYKLTFTFTINIFIE